MEMPNNKFTIMDVFENLAANGSLQKSHQLVQGLDIDGKFELIRLKSFGWLEFENGSIMLTEHGRISLTNWMFESNQALRTA